VHYKTFGWHLLIDAKNCDSRTSLDKKAVSDFMAKLVKDTKMVAVGGPNITYHHDEKEGVFGLSAVQIIETSDITFHFDTKTKEGYFDFFSCKKFEPKKAIEDFQECFNPTTMVTRFLRRNSLKF